MANKDPKGNNQKFQGKYLSIEQSKKQNGKMSVPIQERITSKPPDPIKENSEKKRINALTQERNSHNDPKRRFKK
ncbi:hypothetical protein CHS0354_024892 [Potamilus streckersoni]|uniref:Uncharacterized protein n=1 Tax=Potamilus streckersoni TaxID=2493646 RepID=A0AAE0TG67_9BIVA|nr:hypothetical protein CHS0354_024892 [Potamilus streckersoni]